MQCIFGKLASCCTALTLLVLGASTPLLAADSQHPEASFKVSDMTAVPGKTLPPGTYSIHIVDHLKDRYIVRVEGASADGAAANTSALFIGIPNKRLPHGSQGRILWNTPADGAIYLRGWNFPTLPTPLEFAYPKNDAVAVAKANNAQVPAIDPESEGIISKASLSKDEMHIITLWLLSPTTVGPNAPAGIQAARYQEVASVTHKPVVARLPHTASLLPWSWLIGTLSLAGAFGLRLARLGVKQ